MKKLEFETSKGKFLVVDEKDYSVFHLMLTENGHEAISLKEITEEQASEIVDSLMSGNVLGKLFTGLENHRIEIYQHEGKNIKFIRIRP